jgi:hypothetical protein
MYQKSVKPVNEHIKNIYREGELEEFITIRNNQIVQKKAIEKLNENIQFIIFVVG